MTDLVLVQPECKEKCRTARLQKVLDYALEGRSYQVIRHPEEFQDMQHKRILFAISQGVSGINLEYFRFLKKLRLDPHMLEGSVGGVIVDGESELYTKSIARDFAFTANQAGCTFPGRPLVEGTGSLQNFNIQAMNQSTDNMGAYLLAARGLVDKVLNFSHHPKKRPKLLMLHASSFATSNTVNFWKMVKEHLNGCDIEEISLRNGSVQDCAGCPYKMCLHFSRRSNCYYGGVIVEQVYPAVQNCDAIMLLCPNYNDAISANLSAFINRLTALFRKHAFSDKYLFAIVISGYSGGDLVAEQLISGLNMNKSFILPPRFAFLETANNPKSILAVDHIQDKAKMYAEHILDVIRLKSEPEQS